PSSGFALWLKEVVRIGFLDFKLIPKHFRELWYRSDGFKFLGDNLTSKIYSEVEYARRLKAGTVDAIVKKTRGNAEEASKSV
ncbi:hypothetical protein MYX76_17100, partial [Desulfobacterota bacterium AH_259_B03_O07]|nr:hypothetical protein [Desulfobacterota bacterium AH_259_B03_O07]